MDRLPPHLRRDSLKYYYLSVWPGLRKLERASDLRLPARPGPTRSAYVHIPFCSGICNFCSYLLTVEKPGSAAMDKYIGRLVQQVRAQREETEMDISYLYVGGGTPSLLTAGQMARLLDGLAETGVLSSPLVGTVELHPETFRDGAEFDRVLDTLHQHGVNRVSIGYQSSDDNLLAATHRRHRADFLPDAVRHLRSRGFLFNVDLMYGLPGQSLSMWIDSIGAVLQVRPDSVSTYFTFVGPGTTLWQRAQAGRVQLSSHETAQTCHIAAQLVLEHAGYHELPNDFYSVPAGDPTRFTQQALPSQADSLAIGAGAYGYYPGVQYFNEFDLAAYDRAVADGRSPLWRAAALSGREELCRDVMFSLKNEPALNVELFASRHGVDLLADFPEQFEQLEGLALAEITDTAVWLTPKGRLVAEEIACMFEPERPDAQPGSAKEGALMRKHHYAPTYAWG